MQRALGYIQHIGPESTVQYETFTCGHCNSIVRMEKDVSLQSLDLAIRRGKEKRDIRRCGACDRLVCPNCHKQPTCTPFEKVLEAIERRDRLRSV